MKYQPILCVFLCVWNFSDCARILGFFQTPSISHQIVFQPIWKELSLKGHQVTVITPNPLNDPKLVNLTEIDVSSAYEIYMKIDLTKFMSKENYLYETIINMYNFMSLTVETEMEHPEIKSLLSDRNKQFDLVLVESHSPFAFGFAGYYEAPVIGISSLGIGIPNHDAVGNPTHPVLTPEILLGISDVKTFCDRLQSVLYNIWFRALYNWYLLPKQDALARKYFGDVIPYLGDIERNVSLMMVNVNPIMQTVRPNVPAIVELSQMHIKPKQKLPTDIQEFLDEAKEGVIYFSLGSNVKSSNLPERTREVIKQALSELPYKVLWKWETDHLPGKPENVWTKKWLPQQDILGHRNIKAFVTQGGIQSMEEAISNRVPLIAMPFNADQPQNAHKMVDLGIAEAVDFKTMTKDNLKNTILKVAQNKKYKEKVTKLQKILTDQPMVGVEKAVWWIEYVLRHEGAHHLRSPAVDMPLMEYLLVDVIAFLLLVVCISSYMLFKTIKCLLKSSRTNVKVKKQ